jgi:hypothetical protein
MEGARSLWGFAPLIKKIACKSDCEPIVRFTLQTPLEPKVRGAHSYPKGRPEKSGAVYINCHVFGKFEENAAYNHIAIFLRESLTGGRRTSEKNSTLIKHDISARIRQAYYFKPIFYAKL